MVARIYVNSPALRESQNNTTYSVRNRFITLGVAVAAAYACSAQNLCYSVICFLAVYLLKYLNGNLRTKSRFQRAVIEITSFGVQLVSIYGHDCSSLNQNGKKIESEAACRRDVHAQLNVSGIKKNAMLGQNSSLHNVTTTCSRRVRVFIPRERIIDVIVMEIVWPHCVWSQIAFRVDKGSEVSKNGRSDHSNSNERFEQCSQSQNPNPVSTGNMNKLKENHCESEWQCKSDAVKISSLMERNLIEIIPVLPEECRGQLSYKECLQLQEEIEELLDGNT